MASMGGLLTRALHVQRIASKPARASGESDIPADERRELVAEIDRIVAKARVPPAAGPVPVTSRSHDLLLPLLVNAGAVLIICSAALIIPAILGGKAQSRSEGTGAGLVGEAALVGALKTESEQTVRKVQTSLQAALKERDQLAAGAETLVRRKQQELEASLQTELAAEKERLKSEGNSNVAIERQLRASEQQRRTEAERQLSDYQRQVDSQIAQKNAEIQTLQAQSTSTRQEQDRLAAMETRTQGEQLVLDQLTASYAKVVTAMKAGRWDEAQAGLDALGSYLDQPAVAALPAVQKRRTVDLFLIDSLRRLTRADNSPGPATPAMARAVAEAISAGNALYAQGNWAGSLERYGAALQALRDVGPGVETLEGRIADAGFRQGMAGMVAGQDAQAKAALAKADALAAAGADADALSAYVSLIQTYPQSAYAQKATAGVHQVVDALVRKSADEAAPTARANQLPGLKQEEARAAARAKLQALVASLNDSAGKSSASASAAQEELISLLQTKVDVREILLSDPVRSKHPELAAKLDRFLDLTAEVRRAEGRAAAMKDAAAVIDSLAGGTTSIDLSKVLQKYSADGQRSSFQKFLDALREIFP